MAPLAVKFTPANQKAERDAQCSVLLSHFSAASLSQSLPVPPGQSSRRYNDRGKTAPSGQKWCHVPGLERLYRHIPESGDLLLSCFRGPREAAAGFKRFAARHDSHTEQIHAITRCGQLLCATTFFGALSAAQPPHHRLQQSTDCYRT